MINKEKVRQGVWQCLLDDSEEEYETQCWDCPYYSEGITLKECKTQLRNDFDDLLKEQDECKYIPCKVKTKTGKWDGEKCSACGSTYLGSVPHKWRYCPDCGAKMEGR